jgi:hypothetical protein
MQVGVCPTKQLTCIIHAPFMQEGNSIGQTPSSAM